MSRASDQRVVYALHKGRLVPKSEVLGGQVAMAKAAPAVDAVATDVPQDDEQKRRGRPPKGTLSLKQDDKEEAETESAFSDDDFKIED